MTTSPGESVVDGDGDMDDDTRTMRDASCLGVTGEATHLEERDVNNILKRQQQQGIAVKGIAKL